MFLTTIILQKNSELVCIIITPHTQFGGWGFFLFQFLTSVYASPHTPHAQTEWKSKNRIEKQDKLCLVLLGETVIEMKIREIGEEK